MELPPGPPSSARMLVRWTRDPQGMLEALSATYGDPFTLRLPKLPPFVMLSDPAAVKDLFTGDPDVLLSGRANRILQATLGTYSLLLFDGDEHLRERRLMLPPFHGERMRADGDLMTGVTERAMAGWPSGRAFAVAPHARAIALEVIMRGVFGVEDPDRLRRMGRALRRLLDATVHPYRVALLFMLK